MRRHEIPTHLEVADRAFYGLTVGQLLTLAGGLALAYGAASGAPAPFAARVVVAAVVLLASAVLALLRPAGRPAEAWAFVLLRYLAAPRVSVWRPIGRLDPAPARLEVTLPRRDAERGATRKRSEGEMHVLET